MRRIFYPIYYVTRKAYDLFSNGLGIFVDNALTGEEIGKHYRGLRELKKEDKQQTEKNKSQGLEKRL